MCELTHGKAGERHGNGMGAAFYVGIRLNPLHAELNPICNLLALLGIHHIFHVSGLRVKSDGLNDDGSVTTPNAGCECRSCRTPIANLNAVLNIPFTCQPYCRLQ